MSSLGKGMKNGILTDESIEGAILILDDFIRTSQQYHSENIIITGTSASREAKNISQISNWLLNEHELKYHN